MGVPGVVSPRGFHRPPPAGLLAPRGLVVGSAANRAAHHTAEFACPHLVVRRGQPFDLRVLLPRPFDPEDDSLCVELTLGQGGTWGGGEGRGGRGEDGEGRGGEGKGEKGKGEKGKGRGGRGRAMKG